jgi:glycosyltransferase involved in cell wall biosynthesis
MSEPLVSIQMVTYNHAHYIAMAIEGVLMQKTAFSFELVIGEDCSTDGTRKIVFEYANKYPDIIRVVTSENNVGVNSNCYRTAQACRGKYIAWCDGDDYWHRDNKLQMQIAYLEAHQDCGLVYSDYDYYEVRTGKRIRSYNRYRGKAPPADPELSDLLRGKCGILTCTVCARLDAVREMKAADPEMYASNRFLMGDTPLWADILSRSKVHYFDESLATHNILAESASKSECASRQQLFYKSNAEMRVYVARKHGLPPSEIQSYEQDLYDSSLSLAFLDQDKELGINAWRGLSKRTLRRRMLFWGSQRKILNRFLRTAGLCKNRLERLIFSSK